MNSISIYFLGVNIFTLTIYCLDKILSKTKAMRISENTLLLFCFIGGGVGGFLAMQIVRHKTKHKKFLILVPVSIAFNLALLYAFLYFAK